MVLDASRAVISRGEKGLPPTGRRRDSASSSRSDDSWAWAHAQIIGAMNSGPPVETRLSDDFGPVNLSRVICPRKLVAKQELHRVPRSRVRRRDASGTRRPWWNGRRGVERVQGDDEHEITLPVFDHWSFSTAADGDFWSLAKKLVGIPAPWNVGRRVVDTSHPGFAIPDLAPDDPGRTQIIKCALTAPSTAQKPDGVPDDSESWNADKTLELATELNLPDELSVDVDGAIPKIYRSSDRGFTRDSSAARTRWTRKRWAIGSTR